MINAVNASQVSYGNSVGVVGNANNEWDVGNELEEGNCSATVIIKKKAI